MNRKKVWIPVVLVLGVILMPLFGFRTLLLHLLSARGAFDPSAAPPAPDYRQDAAWSALPTRSDAGDPVPEGTVAVDQQTLAVDVFYVHPTSYVGRAWNGAWDDPTVVEGTDRASTGIQATAFNGVAAVYAPRYRQANGMTFVTLSADGRAAQDLAAGDLRQAFAEFQRRRGPNRPFIVAGHSQGAMLVQRILEEEVGATELKNRLVYAILPGSIVPPTGLKGIPACERPDQTGCVLSWNARGPGFKPGPLEMAGPPERLCVNPLSWYKDEKDIPADRNLGAVFLESKDHRPQPAFADASCEDGRLVVRTLGKMPRDLASRILDSAVGPENYHPVEYQIFFMNIRQNAEQRVAAWKAQNPPG
ncbi:MAG TPA: DUF3089 domain-containing protein [Myxococcota bacterium]|nr:DUF3089 domain-containing protein [Myxococcota bacterium]